MSIHPADPGSLPPWILKSVRPCVFVPAFGFSRPNRSPHGPFPLGSTFVFQGFQPSPSLFSYLFQSSVSQFPSFDGSVVLLDGNSYSPSGIGPLPFCFWSASEKSSNLPFPSKSFPETASQHFLHSFKSSDIRQICFPSKTSLSNPSRSTQLIGSFKTIA